MLRPDDLPIFAAISEDVILVPAVEVIRAVVQLLETVLLALLVLELLPRFLLLLLVR